MLNLLLLMKYLYLLTHPVADGVSVWIWSDSAPSVYS